MTNRKKYSIEVESYQGHPVPSPQVWALGQQGGKIGRGDDCTFVLPDDNRIISRNHATVHQVGGTWYWTDLGANTSFVNGAPVEQGIPKVLGQGDVIGLGDYVLRVQLTEPMPQASILSEQEVWDSLSSLGAAKSSALDANSALNLDFLEPKEASIDDLLGSSAALHELDALLGEPEAVPDDVLSHRFFMGITDKPTAAPTLEPVAFQREPAVLPTATVGELSALHKGLGLSADQHLEAEQAYLVGRLLRISLVGSLQLLRARRVFRHEVGVGVTEIVANKNNPLKFSADEDEALERLLINPRQGYLEPEQAMEQTFHDLLEHSTNAMAGLQTALQAMLTQLSPEQIKQQVEAQPAGILQSSAAKKAKLWDAYCEAYRSLGSKADDPMSRLLSESFGSISSSRGDS